MTTGPSVPPARGAKWPFHLGKSGFVGNVLLVDGGNEVTQRPLHVAVCFLAFDRHHLVRLCLERLLRFLPEGWDLRVWQDGEHETHSGNIVGDAARIQRNLAYYAAKNLAVDHEPGRNRGIALTYWSAERWAFETMQADIGIFIEDDIVVGEQFFPAMASLARIARNDPRVGAFSAYGHSGAHCATQWLLRNWLTPMHHRWGYGITRDYWQRTKQDYEAYLRILEGHDYRDRPDPEIKKWIASLGGNLCLRRITSQDGARTAIMLKLGCFSIMTTPSYAVNIGKRGVHFKPISYLRNRNSMKGRHAFVPWPVNLAPSLSAFSALWLNLRSRWFLYW